MEITKYGTITISKEEVLFTGFTVDGERHLSDQLFPNAGNVIVEWAIQRLTENPKQAKIGFLPEILTAEEQEDG